MTKLGCKKCGRDLVSFVSLHFQKDDETGRWWIQLNLIKMEVYSELLRRYESDSPVMLSSRVIGYGPPDTPTSNKGPNLSL